MKDCLTEKLSSDILKHCQNRVIIITSTSTGIAVPDKGHRDKLKSISSKQMFSKCTHHIFLILALSASQFSLNVFVTRV